MRITKWKRVYSPCTSCAGEGNTPIIVNKNLEKEYLNSSSTKQGITETKPCTFCHETGRGDLKEIIEEYDPLATFDNNKRPCKTSY